MELLEYVLQLLRDRKAEVGSILQNGEAIVGDRPEDDRCAQDTRLVQYMDVQHLGDPDQKESQNLPAEAAEADRGTELPVLDRAHHARDIVHDHEDQQQHEEPSLMLRIRKELNYNRKNRLDHRRKSDTACFVLG